jgi:hypothetical protein
MPLLLALLSPLHSFSTTLLCLASFPVSSNPLLTSYRVCLTFSPSAWASPHQLGSPSIDAAGETGGKLGDCAELKTYENRARKGSRSVMLISHATFSRLKSERALSTSSSSTPEAETSAALPTRF